MATDRLGRGCLCLIWQNATMERCLVPDANRSNVSNSFARDCPPLLLTFSQPSLQNKGTNLGSPPSDMATFTSKSVFSLLIGSVSNRCSVGSPIVSTPPSSHAHLPSGSPLFPCHERGYLDTCPSHQDVSLTSTKESILGVDNASDVSRTL